MPPKWFTQKARIPTRSDAVIAEPPPKRARENPGQEPKQGACAGLCIGSSVGDVVPAVAVARVDKFNVRAVAVLGSATTAGGSDEALVDSINAVLDVVDTDGSTRILAAQASDIAYLVSDDLFWCLLCRLMAEISALQAGSAEIDKAAWADAFVHCEDILHHAEVQGYNLPSAAIVPTSDGAWRHALLSEVAADLMLSRMQAGRGFNSSAMVAPHGVSHYSRNKQQPGSAEGLAPKVEAVSSSAMPGKLIEDLETTLSPSSAIASAVGHGIGDRLSALANIVTCHLDCFTNSSFPLRGGWSLDQEESIRIVGMALQEEYSIRRKIMLQRLDVTVQALCSCEKACVEEVQRYTSKVLSGMWAGWRKSASEASLLSVWSALAASFSMLSRATENCVSGPREAVSSKVKSFRMIAQVPDRGGVPESYAKSATSATNVPRSMAIAKSSGSSSHGHMVASAPRVIPQSWYDLGPKRPRGYY